MTKEKGHFIFKVSEEIYKKINEIAKKENMTKQDLLTFILSDYLDHEKEIKVKISMHNLKSIDLHTNSKLLKEIKKEALNKKVSTSFLLNAVVTYYVNNYKF